MIIFTTLFFALLLENCLCSTTESSPGENHISDNCNEENLNFSKNGSLQLPLHKRCEIYAYQLNTNEKSSIIGITVTSQTLNDTSEFSLDNITVNFQEKLKSNGSYSYNTTTSWTFPPEISFKNYYFSRSFHLKFAFLVGNETDNLIKIHFQEITFDMLSKNSSEDESREIKPWTSIEGRSYRPNSIYLYRVLKSENLTSSNIMFTIHSLDIDHEIGEYLLIGAGSEPFEGPPPLYISQLFQTKKYLVNDESAYVVFATRSTRKNHKGFHISWKYTGKQIEKKEEISNEDILESVPICIYNMTAALAEFNKSQDWFEDFSINLAAVASKYGRENLLLDEDKVISSSSVSIYRISGTVKVNETHKALHAMVKISSESEAGRAVFKCYQLEQVIDMYIKQYSQNGADVYQIGRCPIRNIPESWASLLPFIIIPVVCCLFLLVWTWKHNPVLEYLAKKNRRKRISRAASSKYYQDDCSSVSKSISQNPYTSLPKLQASNNQGRRYTVNLSEVLLSDGEQSDDELFNKMMTPKDSNKDIFQQQKTTEIFAMKRPEINQAFEMDEDSNVAGPSSQSQDQREEKFEHMYDSVKSIFSLNEEKENVTDTKL